MKRTFADHELLAKYHSRLITTKLLMSFLNTGYYISITLLPGQNFELENRRISDRIFLKTLNRE